MPNAAPALRSIVLVGGDSAIGRQLVVECQTRGIAVLGSTRRTSQSGQDSFFLDLAKPDTWGGLPRLTSPVIIAAAQTGFAMCERDAASEMVNVEAPVEIARRAIAENQRVIFISTNTVFDGARAFCSEDDPVSPVTVYSRQKAEAERRLGQLSGWASYGNVVRLTKVLSRGTSPLPAWQTALDRGEPVAPFSDLVFAPISIQFAARSLIQIAGSSSFGTLHVSGAADITYADFARRWVRAQGLSNTRVMATTSEQAGVRLLHRPRYSALRMARTRKLTGIAPQNINDVIGDLLHVEPCLH